MKNLWSDWSSNCWHWPFVEQFKELNCLCAFADVDVFLFTNVKCVIWQKKISTGSCNNSTSVINDAAVSGTIATGAGYSNSLNFAQRGH